VPIHESLEEKVIHTEPKAERSVQENTKGEEEKPLSTAQRRAKIKAALMEGSEEAGFKGYHRRMW